MKRLFCFAEYLVVFLLAVVVPLPVLHASPGEKLIVKPLSFDCGALEEGESAVMTVTLENIGDNQAVIQNVRTS